MLKEKLALVPVKESSHEYLALLGYLYLRHGKIAAATTILEGLAVMTPGDGWVRAVLAYAYLSGSEYQKCLEQLDRTSRAKRSTAEQVMRIRALCGLGRRDEARRLLEQLQGRLRESDG